MACHIAAASGGPGARRVVPSLSQEKLIEINNGIWMCYQHGKIIDADEVTYTIPMLKTWRELAELEAKLTQEQGKGIDLSTYAFSRIPLPENEMEVSSLDSENQIIGDAYTNSCISAIWGKDVADAARDLTIEFARNALTHGRANRFILTIKPNSIILTDDGDYFDSQQLQGGSSQGGGTTALNRLLNKFGDRVLFLSSREVSLNKHLISLPKTPEEVLTLTDCSIKVEINQLHEGRMIIQSLEGCENIYLVLPTFFTFSDAYQIPRLIASYLPKNKMYIFVGRDISDNVSKTLLQIVPDSKFMSL
jgi:hypothetical protein